MLRLEVGIEDGEDDVNNDYNDDGDHVVIWL